VNAATTTRVPPHNNEAERALLGAMLLKSSAFTAAAAAVQAGDFYHPAHGHIYDAITTLYTQGTPIDVVTVADRLDRAGLLDAIGGAGTLTDILGEVASIGNAEHYADIVADLARQRALIGIAAEIHELGLAPTNDVPAAVDQAEQLIYRLADTHKTNTATPVRESLIEWLDNLSAVYTTGGRARGTETGFDDFDDLVLGLHPGQLVVVAGRPGMGKTAFGADVARHAATAGHPTLLVSLEMGSEEVTNRLISGAAHVPLAHIRSANISDVDWYRIGHTVGTFTDIPLEILDDSQATILSIRGEARRVASRYGRIGLIVVDYLQLVDSASRHNNREGEVAEVARGLKKLARELRVPVLALAQLNRGLEMRADKRPLLSDLRESGEIENAADVVAFLYRDDYYNRDSPDRGIAEIIVAKQRNGPTGTVRLAWLAHYTSFSNMARV
jgi:replicative DNA helicase